MEKLIVAIVQSRHNKKLKEAMLQAGFGATELLSQGAFLGKRSSTFLVAVPETKVESALEIIRKTCRRKKVFLADTVINPAASAIDLPLGRDSTRLEIGGALVFILPIEKSERV